MANFKTFEEIEAWKEARDLCKVIFELTKRDAFSKDYSLIRQSLSCSGSIMDNIAEGFEREGNKEFIQFLAIAKGSAGELRSQLYRMADRGYISNQELTGFYDKAVNVSRMLSNLIKYLKNSELKGSKFKKEH